MAKQPIQNKLAELIEYIDSLEITKISFGKLFITDPMGNLVIEVSGRGKNAFVKQLFFDEFNTNESEVLILLKDKFKYKTIDSVIFM